MASVHHIELLVPDIIKARPRWAWVMAQFLVDDDGYELEIVAQS